MCRVYGVTRAGYYAWCSRRGGKRRRENERLIERIRAVHRRSRGIYGSPRVYQALRRRGCQAGENRVARLMRAQGIKARVATIRYTNPTLQRFFAGARNEQLEVDLQAPDQVWVGDITYLKVGGIYRYLAVVMDKYSRRIVGWAYGKRKDVALTLKALNRAVRYRSPARGLIFHTDRGIEYAAGAFKERLAELGITQSMNRPGKINDNAYIESFFHSMKSEIVHGLTFAEDREIEQAVRAYIPFYNDTRLHSSLNYVPPATYEQLARPGVN
jgi:transposase InsO family protein